MRCENKLLDDALGIYIHVHSSLAKKHISHLRLYGIPDESSFKNCFFPFTQEHDPSPAFLTTLQKRSMKSRRIHGSKTPSGLIFLHQLPYGAKAMAPYGANVQQINSAKTHLLLGRLFQGDKPPGPGTEIVPALDTSTGIVWTTTMKTISAFRHDSSLSAVDSSSAGTSSEGIHPC